MACKDGGGEASPFNRCGRILKRGEGRCKIEASCEFGVGSAPVTSVPSPTLLATTARDDSGGSQADLHGRPAIHHLVVATTAGGGGGGDRFDVGSRVSIGREDRIYFWAWWRRPPSGGGSLAAFIDCSCGWRLSSCSIPTELVLVSMGTSLCSLQAAIINNNDIFKNCEFFILKMWLSGYRFNHMA
jgi:hypothetical protein